MKTIWQEFPELVGQLETLAADGYSAGQCARALGHGVTRNSCIGKIHRMGFKHAGVKGVAGQFNIPPVNGLGGKRTKRVPPLVIKPMADEPKPAVDENGDPITVANVGRAHCRFPHGEPGTSAFRFCGHPKTIGSFCDFHGPRCYDPQHPPRSRAA